MIIENVLQGSDDWHNLRCGNPGASNMDKIITSQGKPSKQRQSYLYRLAGELIVGEKTETYKSPSMSRGIELEAEARGVFEFIHGPVDQCGMIYQDESKKWHVSPDGYREKDTFGLEIKAPEIQTHVEYLDKNKLPTKYIVQVQSSLACTGWPVWYFMSYYPGMKPLILPVERDEKLISMIQDAVESFCEDLHNLVERLG